jgi:outer membrane protein OmpA-like peptidoglycan-associated protein
MEVGAFGEERPLVTGSNEDAWAANRRAEFRVLSGL